MPRHDDVEDEPILFEGTFLVTLSTYAHSEDEATGLMMQQLEQVEDLSHVEPQSVGARE